MPEISIIVPVYNSELLFCRCINSILSQNIRKIEVILIDDGSIDGSGTICDKYSCYDDRIITIHKKNKGQSLARNLGLDLFSGDYVAFVDNDDIVHPLIYEIMLSAISRFKCFVCAVSYESINSEYIDRREYKKPLNIDLISRNELITNYLKPTWRIPIWNKLYKKEILNNIRFANIKLGEDNLFSYKVIKEIDCMSYVDVPLYYQVIHDNNFEYSGWTHMNDLLLAKEIIINDVKKSFPNEYRNMKVQFIDECIRVYNMYCDHGDEGSKYRNKSLQILIRNLKKIFMLDLPIGRKVLLAKIKLTKGNSVKGKIQY